MPSPGPDAVPVLDAVARIVELGGAPDRQAIVGALRARFEGRTGAFAPEDAWFEERSRAFWCDAVTRGRFGREVTAELTPGERAWVAPLERAHRGLFRVEVAPAGRKLVDVWSGAEIVPTVVDEGSAAELDASAGQLLDARVVGADEPLVLALLPGAVFHTREATPAIQAVLATARAKDLSTDDTLDALLRMERSLRALSRVKAAYAYRVEALASPDAHGAAHLPVRRAAKGPT
jgi:hypothetical protein